MSDLQFRTKKTVLRELLEQAMAVVPTTEVAPVLKNFLIVATGSHLTVSASNMEQTLQTSSELVDVDSPGAGIFPAKRLYEIVRQSGDGELILVVTESTALITVDKTQWSLKLVHAMEEYPALPHIESLPKTEIDRERFLTAITAVRKAAATEPYRQNLRMLDISNNRMRAADGVRFQQISLGQDFPMNFHLPIGAVEVLVRVLSSVQTEQICIAQDENNLYFQVDSQVFITYKATALFPDVDEMQLKPALANDQELVVDRASLVAAIKQVRITANPDTSAVVLSLSKDSLEVSSKDKTGSWARTEIEVSYDGPDKEIGVNHHHLLDMLTMAGSAECHFFLGEGKKSRLAPLMLKNDDLGSVGVLNQLAGKNFE